MKAPLATLMLVLATGAAHAQDETLFIAGNVITGRFWQAALDHGDGTGDSCALTPRTVDYYSASFFTDLTADAYSLRVSYASLQPGFVYLYQDAFDPRDPCRGLFQFGLAPLANIEGIHLDAHRQYVFVTSEAELFGGSGSFQALIEGPAGCHLAFGTVPVPPVRVSAGPVNAPATVPASGGSLPFEVTLQNTTAQSQLVDLWTVWTGPASQSPALVPRAITVPAEATLHVVLVQHIPAALPAGNYVYSVYIGNFPARVLDGDGFAFSKSG